MQWWNPGTSMFLSERNPDCLVIQPAAYSPYLVSYPSSPYTNGKRNLGHTGNRWKEQF